MSLISRLVSPIVHIAEWAVDDWLCEGYPCVEAAVELVGGGGGGGSNTPNSVFGGGSVFVAPPISYLTVEANSFLSEANMANGDWMEPTFSDDYGGDVEVNPDVGPADVVIYPDEAPNYGGIFEQVAGQMPGVIGRMIGGGGNVGRAIGMGALGAAGRGAGKLMTKFGTVGMSKVWALVQKYGLEFTAGALGYGAADLLQALVASGVQNKRRRRRGISARDIRTTKRTVRFVNYMQHAIGCVTRPRRAFGGRGSATVVSARG